MPLEGSATTHAAQQIEAYLHIVKGDGERVLRDRQVEVMSDLHRFLQTHADEPHGYISLPTGVGKTVLFTELVKATDLRTLILTPTKGLISQTEQAFQHFGSRTQVGKVYGEQQNGNERITISTYASFVRHTKRESHHIAPGKFGLIVLDEAHRALGDETQRALAKYSDAIQVGFTATEDYSERRRLQSLLPTEIHKMTIKEAVNHGLITPFANTIVKTGVDISSVRITQTNEYDSNDLEAALNTGHRNQIALRLYKQHFAGQKAIIFCNGVAHAEAVAEVFNQGGISTKAVHGKLTLQEQVMSKEALADHGPHGFDVLTNDKILVEGFDVPAATVCLNLAPTLSRVRAQQRGGRVLRLDPDNHGKIAHIVDFIDESYQKPPVLFADPRIGEQALVGVEALDSSLNAENDDNIGLTVITDPQEVTNLAQDFYEQHRVTKEFAPEGWHSAGQVRTLYGITAPTVHHYLDTATNNNSERCRKFHIPYAKSKIERKYYSPEAIKDFAHAVGRSYIDFKTVFPQDWMKREEFESHYSSRVIKSLYQYTKQLDVSTWVDSSTTINGQEYFGPLLRHVLIRANTPSSHWIGIEELMDTYMSDEAEVENIIKVLARREKKLRGIQPLWRMVDGRETLYTFPVAAFYIEQELQHLRSQPDEPKDFEENKVVTINKNTVPVVELARLFEQHSTRQARETDKKRKQDLDALYAEFL